MGWLRRLGQAALPIIGTAIGGPIGGAVGIIGSTLGGGRGGQVMNTGGITSGIPQFPGIPGPFGGINVPSFGGSSNGNGVSTNGQFSGDVAQLLGGDRLIMEPEQKTINTAPPGWVIATMPDGSKKAVRKEVARCLGLWKARKKPPISASDWSKLKTANRVKNKAKKIAQTADFKCVKK